MHACFRTRDGDRDARCAEERRDTRRRRARARDRARIAMTSESRFAPRVERARDDAAPSTADDRPHRERRRETMGTSAMNGTPRVGRDARKTTRGIDGKENDARARPFRRGIDEEDDFEEDLSDARGEDEDEDVVAASARAVGRHGSARGILSPSGSFAEKRQRSKVRFESSLPNGFPERKPSMTKLSSGAFDDSSAREEAVAPFVGLVMVFLTVAFVAWFNDVLVRSVSSASAWA